MNPTPHSRSAPFTLRRARAVSLAGLALTITLMIACVRPAVADETCQSPYMPKITGQEEYLYAWTLGVEGLGDGSDKLVTIDVRPGSKTYGKVVHTASVGGRHEAHHGGFTDDRSQLWLAGLDDSRIFIFDVRADPSNPRLVKTIEDFTKASGGAVGPHGVYALPGRMLISALSNDRDHGGRTALVEYANDGHHLATHWLPTADEPRGAVHAEHADGYGYDARVLPRKNVMLSTSFTGWSNYMMDFGKMLQDPEAMKRFGQTAVLWNLHTRKPQQVFQVPGAPLEIRWALGPNHNYAFTAAALTSTLWLVRETDAGDWEAKAVAEIGDPSKVPLPVDISLSSDDATLFVTTFMDGKLRVFDVSDPEHPRQTHEQVIGRQLNMVSQSWDGKRVYCSSSLLANWDKKGEDNEQFVKGYTWNGTELTPTFTVDFNAEKLGRPHLMRFGSASLYN